MIVIWQQLQSAEERRVTSVQMAIQQFADIEKQSLLIVTTCNEGLQQAASIIQSSQVVHVSCS